MEWIAEKNFRTEYLTEYQCSERPMKLIDWQMSGTKDHVFGVLAIIYGVLTLFAYIPCLMVIRTRDNFKISCFKIMFYLGLGDMGCIFVNSVVTGGLMVHGSVFCTCPDFIYISGCFGIALWCNSCLACFVLAFNRLLDLWKPYLVDSYFGGAKTYLWILGCFVYCAFFLCFTRPLIFNSNHGAWFFDPFITTNKYEYHNYPHTINNLVLVFLTIVLYLFYVVVLKHKYTEHYQEVSMTTNPIVFQCMMICLAHGVASLVYVYMNFFEASIHLVRLGHICWMLSHGIPCFVYLCINKSIRRDVILLFQGKLDFKAQFVTKTALVAPNVHSHGYYNPNLLNVRQPDITFIS